MRYFGAYLIYGYSGSLYMERRCSGGGFGAESDTVSQWVHVAMC